MPDASTRPETLVWDNHACLPFSGTERWLPQLERYREAGADAVTINIGDSEVPLALLMFNVGVELGQLMFVALILVLVMLLRKVRTEWPDWARQVPAYGIGSIASFWFIERLAGF